ncbi:kinase-like domain-containing protein [Mycena olivaceomarginata]|nr:kinase-like domain-containing protein [Mycena olivaceomarginata]
MLTSLANHHSVMEILFKYLKAAVKVNATARSRRRKRNTLARASDPSETADRLCRDFPSILEHVTSTLRDPEGRQQFFACREALAQGLLDLLQDLLDSSYDFLPATRSLLCKALLRLSRKSGLHPTCFILPGLKKVGHQLAGGGYGDIWKGLVDGQTVAVKSMRIFLEDDVKAALKEFGREALIWRQLSHPNLLPFFGLYTLDGRLCLVSPWMANGHLQQFLKNAPPNIDCVALMLDVAMGLEYLHCKHVVHGDLKASNILVTPSGKACIADFGLSSIIDAMAFQFTQSTESMRGGTARYQAPEVLEGTSANHVGSDVYAFACVCYQILTGQLPFFELPNEIKIGIKVIGGYRPSRPEDMKFPDDLWTLLEECWAQASERRPKMPKIVRRLSGFPTSRQVSKLADWDDTCSARFRRAAQKCLRSSQRPLQ